MASKFLHPFSDTRLTGAVAGLLLLAAPAAAVDSSPTSVEDLPLEELLDLEVATVSRRLQPLAWAPARSVVITRGQMDQRRYVNLRDLLQDMPEVDVLGNFSAVSRSEVSIRGMRGNNRFLVLVDGIRVNAFTGDEAAVEDNYPLFDAERVEIIYGPASALYGADALLGIINIVTLRDSAEHGASASGAYGSDQSFYGSARAHAKVGEHLRLSVAAHRQGTDAPDLSSAYPTEFARIGELRSPFAQEPLSSAAADRFSNRTSSSSISARLDVDRALTAGYLRREYSQTTGVGSRPEYTQYDAEAPHAWETAYATYRFNVLPKLGSEAELNYSTYAKLPSYAYNNAFSGFAPQYKYSQNESFTFRQQLTYHPLERLDLVAGFSWTRVHAAPESGGMSSPVDPDLPPASQGLTIPGTSLAFPFYDLSYQVFGTYVQAQAQLLPSLSVTAGLRYDHDGRYGHTLNPRAGIVYELAPRHTAKFLYGESFLAPPAAYQYAFWGTFAGTQPDTGRAFSYWYHVPNPDLGPMKARTAELNYTALLSGSLLLEADVYFTAVEGLIVPRTINSPTTFAGADVYAYEQFRTEGRGRYYGGSASARYQGRVGSLQLEPWGSFSVTQGRVLEAPEQGWLPLAHNVPYKLKGGVTLQYDRFSLTPRVRWSSQSTQAAVREADPTQRQTVPASTLVDAALRVDDLFTRGLSMTLDVRNVLDARYYQPGLGGPLEFAANPQDPRTAMLQVAYVLE